MATNKDKQSESERVSGEEIQYASGGKREENSEGGFVRERGNKLSYNPLAIDEIPQPSPEQERALEIDTDKGVSERLREARAIGPSVRQQTQAEILNLVLLYREIGGNPFSVRRLPFSIMRDMTADPSVAFSYYYIETPLINASWSMDSPDAQLAAAVDSALRPINSDLISKFCNSLEMGYQPLVKRFKLGKLNGIYRDKTSDTPEKDLEVWPSKNVDALMWKAFLALPPENCLPRWNEMGNFDGFMYSPVPIPNPMMLGVAQTYGPQVLSGYPIPLEWSMWIVNERESNFGSLYGQPRTRRAYRYWWSKWYRWALADRSYENKADPAKIVYFPTMVAEALDANNPTSENAFSLQQKAIQAGNSVRSGSTVAFPGDFMVNEEGKTMNQRQWEIKYLEGGENFSSLEQNFLSLDTMIMKCVTADTPIDCPRDHEKYPDGIPIKDIKIGQFVWTFNTNTLNFELNPVKFVAQTKNNQQIYKLSLSNGKFVRCTDEHPFLCTSLEWKYLKNLKIGDRLVRLNRDFDRPFYTYTEPSTFEEACDYASVVSIEKDGKEDVWDISIDAPEHCHNFITGNIVAKNSMFLPEQAFVDATMAGQTSSQRYISAQMGEIYQESQQLISNQYDEYINKYMIPEFIAANFPDKVDIPCKRVTRAYGSQNSELVKQIITLIGQKNPENVPVDIRELLRQNGIPLTTESQQKHSEDKKKEEAELNKPPPMVPAKKEGIAGYNAGVEKTETGEHVYFQPGEEIFLSSSDSFLNSLPKIPPYEDVAVRSAAMQMRKLFMDRYKNQISSFANQIRNKTILKLAEPEGTVPSKPGLSAGTAKIAAAGAVAGWLSDQAIMRPDVSLRLKEILSRIVGAAGRRELKLANLDSSVFDPSTIDKWVESYVNENLDLMDHTTQDVFKDFLENQLQKNSHPNVVAQELEDHFAEMPVTYSARAVRAQTRDAYNTGMLQAGIDAGIDQVMAHDASSGTNLNTDAKCIARNGKIYSLKDALKETEHPNGTLYYSYLTTHNLSVKITDDIPESLELSDNMSAGYDSKTETLFIRKNSSGSENKFLLTLGQKLRF